MSPVAAANFTTALWSVFLEDMALIISRVFNGDNGSSCEQKLLPGPLHIYDVDAITFPCVDVLFHSEANAGATEEGFCSKEFEDIIFHYLKDVKGSSPCGRFSL